MKIDDESVLKALATAMTDDAFDILVGTLTKDRNSRNTVYNIQGVPFEDGKLWGEVHALDGVKKDLLDIQKQIHILEAKNK